MPDPSPTFLGLTVSEWAAWYAAVVATLALILQWRKDRTRLEVRAKGGMVMAPPAGPFGNPLPGDPREWVIVNVDQAAGPQTTIQNVGLLGFGSRWQRLRGSWLGYWAADLFRVGHPSQAMILEPISPVPLPHALADGGTWHFRFLQSELDKLPGTPHILVEHTRARHGTVARIVNLDGSAGDN